MKDNLAEGFISNLSTPVKTESKNVQPTSTSTKTLPELGEAQNKPLMIAAVIILIIGGLILMRSRKK
ncbi:LPXTG cell wall anchor domain-containing protein [Macrococcus armenti]|uniref:LPXTG cell wall anchor domain-containing protein n=1 Tax=Macrococcus armenti TaxID=2875764 RepID=UPI001CCB6E2B|nr:LPXTG cell wall anchor domain-containing protein [Macrococcus armenti]UBH21629.1 LPXTG cell wall anchor domain-containing protein [Macrococcus armenti]